ncbi:MAG TPA: EamA family transporter [Blastocatellia bacterium]|jgi:drug/metabolite transporter (DMT)-like permease|nr:EamA family transporter [Blastocatellia bacterium]
MKTAAVLILAIIAQAIGNVCLTKGMKTITSDGATLLQIIASGLQSPTLWVGTVFLIAFFILYSAALSWADLSFVLPATAFGYVVNVACGYYFLGERVTSARWVGAIIITLGVIFVSRSGERTASIADEISAAGGGE